MRSPGVSRPLLELPVEACATCRPRGQELPVSSSQTKNDDDVVTEIARTIPTLDDFFIEHPSTANLKLTSPYSHTPTPREVQLLFIR